jgi:glyoxylate/hydroxypyruvate reductase
MRITVCVNGINPIPLIRELQYRLPSSTITRWASNDPLADVAVVWAPLQQFFEQQTSLKAIFAISTGVDQLLQLNLPERVPIVRAITPSVVEQMVDYVYAAVFRYFRKLDQYACDQTNSMWGIHKPRAKSNFPIGIMGMGRLGGVVAQRLASDGFTVGGYSTTRKSINGVKSFSGPDSLYPFLQSTQVLVNLLPLTKTTENILNYTTLSLLRPNGYIINVARGEHIVDADLIALLDTGHLAGATLDVFRTEPLPPSDPFWTHPKITITPHIAARPKIAEVIDQIVEQVSLLNRGQSITCEVVDPTKGY